MSLIPDQAPELGVSTQVTDWINFLCAGEMSVEEILKFVEKNGFRSLPDFSRFPGEEELIARIHEYLIGQQLDDSAVEQMTGTLAVYLFDRTPLHPDLMALLPERPQD
jgi:hypothetical protein